MLGNTTVEARLAALEVAVAEIQRRLGIPPTSDWITRMSGSFKDDPDFEEFVRICRELREADRPPDEPEAQP